MKKQKSATGEVFAFPYKSFSAAYPGKNPERDEGHFTKYYRTIAHKLLPDNIWLLRKSLTRDDVAELELLNGRSSHLLSCCLGKDPILDGSADDGEMELSYSSVFDNKRICNYLAHLPLLVINQLIWDSENVQEYTPFFLGLSDKRPKCQFVELREAGIFGQDILDEIDLLKLTFWLMSNFALRSYDGVTDETDAFVSEVDNAFCKLMGSYETIGNDEIWGLTYKIKTLWFKLVDAMDDIAYARAKEFNGFNAILDKLRTAFNELLRALYRLECRRYQELSKKTGTPVYRPREKKKS